MDEGNRKKYGALVPGADPPPKTIPLTLTTGPEYTLTATLQYLREPDDFWLLLSSRPRELVESLRPLIERLNQADELTDKPSLLVLSCLEEKPFIAMLFRKSMVTLKD